MLLIVNCCVLSQTKDGQLITELDRYKNYSLMDRAGTIGVFSPIDSARSQAIDRQKGFEYFQLLEKEREKTASLDSINSVKDSQLADKEIQLSLCRGQTRALNEQSRNNELIARTWKKKARSPKKPLIYGFIGLAVGVLIQR